MLHRALQAFPWATHPTAGEPGDLPESYGLDVLMLAPVNPERLFATWELSWPTRNRLLEELGEERLSQCRLVIRLGGPPWQEVDVSGPSRSWYLEAEGLASPLRGWIGCLEPDGRFHSIAESAVVDLPSSSGQQDPAVEEIYERACRAVGLRGEELLGVRGTLRLAEGRDARLGR